MRKLHLLCLGLATMGVTTTTTTTSAFQTPVSSRRRGGVSSSSSSSTLLLRSTTAPRTEKTTKTATTTVAKATPERSVASSSPSPVPIQRVVSPPAAAAPSATRTTSAPSPPAMVSSKRLTKAKLLLEQFTTDMENGGDQIPSISYQSPSWNQDDAKKMENNKASEEDLTNNNIVPDNFWRNGHLQASSSEDAVDGSMAGTSSERYVTRWAQGVKVAEPLVKYDRVKAEKILFRQPTKWLVRNFQIAWPFSWWVASLVLDVATGQLSAHKRLRAQQLTAIVSDLGPAIIKGGQALASRPDLLPLEYLEELQKLQDDVPRFSNAVALKTVQDELKQPFEQVFELIEQEPIAAASIGQVYKARLVSNGDVIALKIQRPACEEIIALDLYVLRWWAGVYNQIFRLLKREIDLQAIIDDFGELIYREIDYVAEAANAQRFNELYAGVTDVFVPKIYSELTTSKVLTMEWVDGVRLTDQASLDEFGLQGSKLIETLVQCSLQQILENGFYHADPHAGNLLACPDGRLCYLDFGMMSYAAPNQRNGFLLAVVHIVNRDWPELVRLYQRLGFIPANTNLQPIEEALEDAMPDVLSADIAQLNFKNVINQLGDIMYTYPFSLPPFYIGIIRCLGVLEGVAIQVDPKARIISEAYPYVASRVLTDNQPDLQEALRRLALTSDGRVRWGRLESLLGEAKDSSGYDVTAALDLLTDYLLKEDAESSRLLAELSEQIVNAADALGSDTFGYILEASRALAIQDEVAAVKAFRSLQDVLASSQEGEEGFSRVRQKVGNDLKEVLPEPTLAMRRFWRIVSLLLLGPPNESGSSTGGVVRQTDPAKFVPIIRKLAQDSRVQQTASETVARLWERLLSRGLRAAFGLPPPTFGRVSSSTTVTEDKR